MSSEREVDRQIICNIPIFVYRERRGMFLGKLFSRFYEDSVWVLRNLAKSFMHLCFLLDKLIFYKRNFRKNPIDKAKNEKKFWDFWGWHYGKPQHFVDSGRQFTRIGFTTPWQLHFYYKFLETTDGGFIEKLGKY